MTDEVPDGPDNGDGKASDRSNYNGMKATADEIARRFAQSASQQTFLIYIGLVVCLIGGLPIWIEIWRYYHRAPEGTSAASAEGIILALATVFMAIGGGSALEMIFGDNKLMRNLGALAVAGFAFLLVFILGFGQPDDRLAIFLGTLGCAVAVLVCWIARGLDENLQDESHPDDAVGGDPRGEISSRPTKIKT